MKNAEKINQFLNNAKAFYLLTVDGEQSKWCPFGFHLLDGDKIYFGTETVKKCYRQLTKNPHVEILALSGQEFLRYDGISKTVKSNELTDKVRKAILQVMEMYDQSGLEIGLFYLENGTAEIRTAVSQKEAFEVQN